MCTVGKTHREYGTFILLKSSKEEETEEKRSLNATSRVGMRLLLALLGMLSKEEASWALALCNNCQGMPVPYRGSTEGLRTTELVRNDRSTVLCRGIDQVG